LTSRAAAFSALSPGSGAKQIYRGQKLLPVLHLRVGSALSARFCAAQRHDTAPSPVSGRSVQPNAMTPLSRASRRSVQPSVMTPLQVPSQGVLCGLPSPSCSVGGYRPPGLRSGSCLVLPACFRVDGRHGPRRDCRARPCLDHRGSRATQMVGDPDSGWETVTLPRYKQTTRLDSPDTNASRTARRYNR
jgi:hypothetical protein